MTDVQSKANHPSMGRRLVSRALAAHIRDFDEPVIEKAKLCLLDFLSCAFEARHHPWSKQAIGIARAVTAGATIIGAEVRAAPGDAAFANAVMGHGLVREDMHAASIGHHGVVIWPVLLALSEGNRISGERLLAAAIAGYETGAVIGSALFDAGLARLFRPTGVVGPLGGAMAGACLLSLDEDTASSALALSANSSSGLNEWPHHGGSEMYFHPGFAARNAITAIELAQAGAYGSETILEGQGGLFAAFQRQPPSQALSLFEGAPQIMTVYNKAVPACNFAQTACQAALLVAREIQEAEAIETITVELPQAAIAYPGCNWAGPFERALQAKMSIQFSVAATLSRSVIEDDNYSGLKDEHILRLARMIELRSDAAFTAAFPKAQGARVTVQLRQGATVTQSLSDVAPASPEVIRSRFRHAASEAIGTRAACELEELVAACERLPDAGRIAVRCRRSDNAGLTRS